LLTFFVLIILALGPIAVSTPYIKNPKQEQKREVFEMFQQMLGQIKQDLLFFLFSFAVHSTRPFILPILLEAVNEK
jgi:preprotein translocase subunit SecA